MRSFLATVAFASVASLFATDAIAHDRDHDHDRCEDIQAVQTASVVVDGTCTSPVGLCTAGHVHGDGFHGTTSAKILGLAESAGMPTLEPGSTLSYHSALTISTKHGDIVLSDVAVFDVVVGVFTELGRISGGSGIYAGATGNLFFSGSFDAATGTYTMAVTGKVCHPR